MWPSLAPSDSNSASSIGGSGRRTREGREEYKGRFIDSVSVQAIKADRRSENLDRICLKLDVTRNKSYLNV